MHWYLVAHDYLYTLGLILNLAEASKLYTFSLGG
jgi:hypothetical protein